MDLSDDMASDSASSTSETDMGIWTCKERRNGIKLNERNDSHIHHPFMKLTRKYKRFQKYLNFKDRPNSITLDCSFVSAKKVPPKMILGILM